MSMFVWNSVFPRSKSDMFFKDKKSYHKQAGQTANTASTIEPRSSHTTLSMNPWQATLYVCGFPCTPFSVLHADSDLWKEAEAKQLFQCIRRLKSLQPIATWHIFVCYLEWTLSIDVSFLEFATEASLLENVVGFRRVLEKILKLLRENLPQYLVFNLYELWNPLPISYEIYPMCVPGPRYEITWQYIDPHLGWNTPQTCLEAIPP